MSRSIHDPRGTVAIDLRSAAEDIAYVTASVTGGSADAVRASAEVYERIVSLLNGEQLQVVHECVFGSLGACPSVMDARNRALRKGHAGNDWPVTYVEGRPLWGEGLAGVTLQAVRPRGADRVWTIREDGAPCGRGWTRNGVTFLILQDLHGAPPDPAQGAVREMQTAQMFDRANRILEQQGLTYRDVLRTWIYLAEILDWYDAFNVVRTAKYGQFGLIPDRSAKPGGNWAYLPASTGISGSNPHGTACVMDVLALGSNPGGAAKVTQMTNVRQKDAVKYGSAFSRGVCIREADVAHVYLSGTAAIDERGKSLFPGDFRRQVGRVFDNVEAALAPQGAALQDICQATVFLERAQDMEVYRAVAAERGLTEMPAVYMVTDICRRDLMFEMDAIATIPSR